MRDSESDSESLVDRIPSAEEVRARLADNLHERDILKRLLKLAEQKRKLSPRGDREVSHAG